MSALAQAALLEPEVDELLERLAGELIPHEGLTLARLIALRAGNWRLAKILRAVQLLDLTGNLGDLEAVCSEVLRLYDVVMASAEVPN
jgi:hypothetical protein